MKIKKVWAVFFSATGTTEKITTHIAKSIAEKSGLEYEVFDFTLPKSRIEVKNFTENDLVVFGSPVYAGRVPNVLLKYLATINGNGAAAIPVVSYGNRNYDDALIELRDVLEKDGFQTIAASAFIGEHSFSRILAKGRPDENDLLIADDFAARIVERLKSGSNPSDFSPINVEGVPFPYRGYYQPLDYDGNSVNILKVKPLTNENCNNCLICVDLCPTGAICRENVREYIGICIKCGACIKKCPQNAKYYDNPEYLSHQLALEKGLTRRAKPQLFL